MPLDDLLNSLPQSQPSSSPVQSSEGEGGSIFDIALNSLNQPKSKSKLSEGEIAGLAEQLVEGWLSYFSAFDQAIRWIDAEREHAIWLCPNDCPICRGSNLDPKMSFPSPCPHSQTLLVGMIDAVGQTQEGELFWADWKTEKPPWRKNRELWKRYWKKSPQALTYGVITDIIYPGIRRFTVRKAFKSSPPSFDYEWFSYDTSEIVWWKGELLNIADEIRRRRRDQPTGPWSPNFSHCFKYGEEYVCPRFHPGCDKLNWNAGLADITGSVERVSHLQVERDFLSSNVGSFGQAMRKGVVILDATRVEKWMNCRERYRGEYELGISEPKGDALEVGGDFHSMLKHLYLGMIKK